MKIFFMILLGLVYILSSCQQEPIQQLMFLEGTWKVTNKKQYEVWEKTSETQLSGYGYRMFADKKVITETLYIKSDSNKIIYAATVPDQNEGQTVPFTLNPQVSGSFSFENVDHDFPKKIQYHKISEDEIEIHVSGKENQGFSFKMRRQKTPQDDTQ